jgi:hypothetical protein
MSHCSQVVAHAFLRVGQSIQLCLRAVVCYVSVTKSVFMTVFYRVQQVFWMSQVYNTGTWYHMLVVLLGLFLPISDGG